MFPLRSHARLPCPFCRYDLRGAEGETITCPECGGRVERGELTSPEYTHPYNVMLRTTLLMPLAFLALWPMVAFIFAFLAGVIGGEHHAAREATLVALLAVGVVIWLTLLIMCGLRAGGFRGLLLVVLLHFVVVVYLVTLMWIPFAAIAFAFYVGSEGIGAQQVEELIPSAGFTLLMIVAYIAARQCDRYIWRECWKQHLRMRQVESSL